MTLISIVTVVRDDRDGFLATRASVEAQTCRDFEWIVVAGTSSDGTADAIADACADGAVATKIHGADHGPFDAMNRGLDAATGRFILFLNAGDRFAERGTLARVGGILRDRPVDLLYGDHLADHPDGTPRLVPASDPGAIVRHMIASHQSMLYARSLFVSRRYETQYAVAADYVLTLHLLMGNIRVVRVPYPISRVASAGISAHRALRGRIEQALARRRVLEQGVPRILWTFLVQSVAWRLHRTIPYLYERLRRHRRVQPVDQG